LGRGRSSGTRKKAAAAATAVHGTVKTIDTEQADPKAAAATAARIFVPAPRLPSTSR
jgi:hypothetical protein